MTILGIVVLAIAGVHYDSFFLMVMAGLLWVWSDE